jgi:hypothetical protein
MDPIQVNINVTLDLSEKTTELLQALMGKAQAPAPAPETKPNRRKVETKPAPAPETKEAPEQKPEPEEPESAEAAPAPAQEEKKVYEDEELREIVHAVRSAKPGNPQIIRNEIFPEFGIKTSIECPMERRAELVARLKELAA